MLCHCRPKRKERGQRMDMKELGYFIFMQEQEEQKEKEKKETKENNDDTQ